MFQTTNQLGYAQLLDNPESSWWARWLKPLSTPKGPKELPNMGDTWRYRIPQPQKLQTIAWFIRHVLDLSQRVFHWLNEAFKREPCQLHGRLVLPTLHSVAFYLGGGLIDGAGRWCAGGKDTDVTSRSSILKTSNSTVLLITKTCKNQIKAIAQ